MPTPTTRSDTAISGLGVNEATGTLSAGAGFTAGDRLPYLHLLDQMDAVRAVSPDGVCQVLNYGQSASVTTAATVIKAANANRITMNVRNIGTADAYIGDASVSATTGHLVKQGEAFDTKWVGGLYAITASGTTRFSYYEEASQ